MEAAPALPGRQGSGIETKIGSWNFRFLGSTATILLHSTDRPKAARASSTGTDWVCRPTWGETQFKSI
jgi:hypothetical protein